jgi:DNA invertase Pin-like site-specific DNA recombinase
MKDAIGYLRVSTKEQGRSGLGLAAQRHDIEAFALREGLAVKSCTRMCRLARERTRCCCDRGLRQR